mmetsp:Transcript_36637/g.55273  ORF Transcript_36637/g.55273 Transcript_36637/m.55273 type:complete len:253 (-) Transcript_36637:622-1380(-)
MSVQDFHLGTLSPHPQRRCRRPGRECDFWKRRISSHHNCKRLSSQLTLCELGSKYPKNNKKGRSQPPGSIFIYTHSLTHSLAGGHWLTYSIISDLLGQLRDLLEQVTNKAVVGDLKDWSVHVLVDGHNGFRVLHTGQVLDSSTDADSNVQFWCHHLAGLTNLELVRDHACIDSSSGSTHRSIELVAKRFEDLLEVLTAFHTPASRNHSAGTCQLGLVALLLRLREPLDTRALVGVWLEGFDSCRVVQGRSLK